MFNLVFMKLCHNVNINKSKASLRLGCDETRLNLRT